MEREKVIVVLPAYNAVRTLEKTIRDIPSGCVDEIILVDDASVDDTVALARKLGLTVVTHERNRGYGANQKTCYRLALDRGADIVVMLHPDYQYDSRVIPSAVGIVRLGICDFVLGNRIRTRNECLAAGMPLYKYIGNRILTLIENIVLGQNLGECHSGFRVYRRSVLERIPYHRNSDGFVFDTQMLVQAVHFGFKVGDLPVPTRYFPEASSISLRKSVVYGIQTLGTLFLWLAHRCHLLRHPLFI